MIQNIHATDENLRKISVIIDTKINNGFVLTERNDKLPFAVLKKEGKEVNHEMNFCICCMTLGIWSLVWIYLSYVSSKDKTILVAIDEDGNAFEDKCYLG
jgi:hypothetical protein